MDNQNAVVEFKLCRFFCHKRWKNYSQALYNANFMPCIINVLFFQLMFKDLMSWDQAGLSAKLKKFSVLVTGHQRGVPSFTVSLSAWPFSMLFTHHVCMSSCMLDFLFTKILWEIVSKTFLKSQTSMCTAFPLSTGHKWFVSTSSTSFQPAQCTQ